MDQAIVYLYIDKGKDLEEVNKMIFDTLYSKKEEIESAFGESLEWDYVEGRRACRIKWTYNKAGLKDEEKWGSIQDKMIDAMIRLEKALKDHIKKLNI